MVAPIVRQSEAWAIFADHPMPHIPRAAAIEDIPAELLSAPAVTHVGRARTQDELESVLHGHRHAQWQGILLRALPMLMSLAGGAGGGGGGGQQEQQGVPTVTYNPPALGSSPVVASHAVAFRPETHFDDRMDFERPDDDDEKELALHLLMHEPDLIDSRIGVRQAADATQQQLPVHLWDPDKQGPACGVDEPLNVTSQDYQVTCVECQVAQQRKAQELAEEQQSQLMANPMTASRRIADGHNPVDLDDALSVEVTGPGIDPDPDEIPFLELRKEQEGHKQSARYATIRCECGASVDEHVGGGDLSCARTGCHHLTVRV